MADIAENAPFTDATTAISQGKRHLLVRDYSMAVTALAQACELLAEKYGDTSDELGEPYLLYGRALLYLAREEAGVLGTGVPGTEEAEEDEEEGAEEDEDDEKSSNVEDKEDEKSENAGAEKTTEKPDSEENTESKEEIKKKAEGKDNESKVEALNEEDKKDKEEAGTSSSDKVENNLPGTSRGDVLTNGKTSETLQNGTVEDDEDDESDDVNKEDEEEDVHNLQVAWEVLELAKLVLLKRGPPGWKLLAEAHRLLGEVAMESGNHQGALNDLKACVDLLNRVEPKEPRVIAETHYQLGLAHSLGNEFDASIEQFNKATTLLETRIKELEEMKDPPKSDDPFYTVNGEINELKELLPEIREKIADMKDFKQEACKVVIEGIRSKVAEGSCSNGAGPSSEGASTSTSSSPLKPASDISHLVRKKRKADEPEMASPSKKPSL